MDRLCTSFREDSREEGLRQLISNLSDNKTVNRELLSRTNAIFDGVSTLFPALDRVTNDDEVFGEWRRAVHKALEKLFKRDVGTSTPSKMPSPTPDQGWVNLVAPPRYRSEPLPPASPTWEEKARADLRATECFETSQLYGTVCLPITC